MFQAISTGQVKKVTFKLLTDEIKLKESAVEINNSAIFADDVTVTGGVFDYHMGTTAIKYTCGTCNLDYDSCPGHPGHISLKYPLKVPIVSHEILDWANIICKLCGMPLLSGFKKHEPSLRFKLMRIAIKERYQNGKVKCHYCEQRGIDSSNEWLTYLKDDDLTIGYQVDPKHFEELHNHEILKRFKKIKDKTVLFFDKNLSYHPKHYITNYIRVSPNNTRPEIRKIEGSISSSDDITKLYQMILNYNNKLSNFDWDLEMDDKHERIIKNMQGIYYHLVLGDPDSAHKIAVENSVRSYLKSFLQNLKSKEGYIRNSTQGKKVDKVARTVIVGDPAVEPGWVIISKKIAMILYEEVLVSERNINEMLIYFENGKDVYPGSIRIIRDGKTKDVNIFKKRYNLKVGDILYRHLIDGDIVDFNRMPSLWWSNVSGHRIKVVEGEWAFRFNEMSCIYYNADFDGDEMQIFTVNNTFSKLELKYLGNVINWGLSYMDGGCMLGLMQDGLLGIGLLTQDKVEFGYKFSQKLFNQTTLFPNLRTVKNHKGELYKSFTGRDILSILLRDSGCIINYRRLSNSYKEKYAKMFDYRESDEYVVIKKGYLLSGIVDKSSTGQGKVGNLFHIIYNEYGPIKANEVVFNMQQLANRYLRLRGFTIGTDDIILKEKDMTSLQGDINEIIENSEKLHYKYINGKLIAPINRTLKDFYEQEQLATLEVGDEFKDKLMSYLDKGNTFRLMGSIGSKGNDLQLMNSIALRGQTRMYGKRPEKSVAGRTTLYSTRNSADPEDRGFIRGSLTVGLNNKHAISDAQEERLGIIGKSQNTAVTGYFNRRYIKANELEVIDNKLSVMTGDEIVQLLYGGDGLDPRRREDNSVHCVLFNDKEFSELKTEITDLNKVYHHDTMKKILDEEYRNMKYWKDYYIEMYQKLETIEHDYILTDSKFRFPVNIKRIVFNNTDDDDELGLFDPKKAIDDINETIEKVIYLHTNDFHRDNKTKLPEYISKSFNMFKVLMYLSLNTKNLIRKKISNATLKIILTDVYINYSRGFMDPGTMSGILRGHSMGQPATQGMLNSIHKGTKKGDINSIKDITELRKNKIKDGTAKGLSNPYMRFETDGDIKKLANDIEMKRLRSFIKSLTLMEKRLEDQPIKKFLSLNSMNTDISNICARIELNRIELIIKDISMDKIVIALYKHFNKFKIKNHNVDVFIAHSMMNDPDLFLYVYLVDIPDKPLRDIRDEFVKHVKNCIIDGISGISSATVLKRNKTFVKDGVVERRQVEYILTEGVNVSVYDLNIKKETFGTNSILEIYNMFGIIVAEQAIISELKLQMEESSHLDESWYVNNAASMTFMGIPLSNTIHGTKIRFKNNKSLMIATEHVLKTLKDAIRDETTQEIIGLSEPLLYSSMIKAGTCFNKITLNNEFIKNNYKTIDAQIEELVF